MVLDLLCYNLLAFRGFVDRRRLNGERAGLRVDKARVHDAGGSLSCGLGQLRHLTHTIPLSTREYKWVLANSVGKLTKTFYLSKRESLLSSPMVYRSTFFVH